MVEDPFKGKEKLALKIEVVEKPTREILEGIRDLRLAAARDTIDAYMLATSLAREQSQEGEQDIKEMFGDNKFTVLAWNGSRLIAVGQAEKDDVDWILGADYVSRDFRWQNLHKKIIATRLLNIKERQGKKVISFIRVINEVSLHNYEFFGFKKVSDTGDSHGYEMELNDINNPEVIKKISEVLNAG